MYVLDDPSKQIDAELIALLLHAEPATIPIAPHCHRVAVWI
jgi:hypothetical protein